MAGQARRARGLGKPSLDGPLPHLPYSVARWLGLGTGADQIRNYLAK